METYYGSDAPQTISYLEFGEINLRDQQKKVWDFRLHQKAYDWLMLGRYANDFLAYTEMNERLSVNSLEQVFAIYNEEIHHSNDAATNFDKLIGLSLIQNRQKNVAFFELGQTIFACIEAIEFYQNLITLLKIPFKTLDIENVHWHGVDISRLFNLLADKIHQNLKISTKIPSAQQKIASDIFFAKGITLLYAIKNIDQLFTLFDTCQLALFDYSFSLGEPEVTTIGTGKITTYLKFDEFLKKYHRREKRLYIKKQNSRIVDETNRIWLDCLYADENLSRAYIEYYDQIREQLVPRLSNIRDADRFLDNTRMNKWIALEDFLDKVRDYQNSV